MSFYQGGEIVVTQLAIDKLCFFIGLLFYFFMLMMCAYNALKAALLFSS